MPATTTDTFTHPPREEIELAAVLHALSDPVRLRIVVGLARDGERTCGGFDLPVPTKSTCTHHFRVLREAGVILQRAEGTGASMRSAAQDLDARFPGLLDTIVAAA